MSRRILSETFPEQIYVVIGDDFNCLYLHEGIDGLEEQPVAVYQRVSVGDIVVKTTFEPQTN